MKYGTGDLSSSTGSSSANTSSTRESRSASTGDQATATKHTGQSVLYFCALLLCLIYVYLFGNLRSFEIPDVRGLDLLGLDLGWKDY